ncbi:MAG: rhomboid family intramembrane serine protease [Hyphomonadaceae bacterium]|jgi:membrane associated rhomboid family serine protease|nr:rhomboid family intramembrane serine protease [Hyphomonadaceae bacterium]
MSQREPIFNVPGAVVALIGSFVVVHVVRTLLPGELGAWLTILLAFIPARLSGMAQALPGGDAAVVTQFVTHIFVHGDLTHLAINSAWLLAFGSSVARRVGTTRFLAFFVLCGIAGALVYTAFSPGALSMMVGASGAISGLMGAAIRFLFQALRTGDTEGLAGEKRRPPLMSLAATLRDKRILLVVAGWTVLNTVMAVGAAGLMDGANIAWEAHLGGFYMGLLTFGFFDRSPPVHDDIALVE